MPILIQAEQEWRRGGKAPMVLAADTDHSSMVHQTC